MGLRLIVFLYYKVLVVVKDSNKMFGKIFNDLFSIKVYVMFI